VNRILSADAYTVSSFDLVSADMRERAAYHLVFRRFEAPAGLAGEGIVFHGLPRILRTLLGTPVAAAEIDEARQVLARFHAGGTRLPFDEAMWQRVAELGHFPLRIWARPDGATVNPGEPVVQVISEPGFGELAAHLESRLVQVWAPSARATVMRRWLAANERLVRDTTDVTDPAMVRFLAQLQVSDFGDRAATCPEESEVLGLAHLTSHDGTDTLTAAHAAWRASGGKFTGNSIRALAHRVVLGYEREEDSFRVLFEVAGDGGISSHVADCFGFERCVREYLVPLAVQAAARGSMIVARPDSGDGLQSILFILREAERAGLSRRNEKGLIEMTSLRFIYADSLSFQTIAALNEALTAAGYSVPMCGIYGVGGALRDGLRRDMLGATYKLAAVGGALRPVAKLSPGGKGSIPGVVRVTRRTDGGPTVFPASPDEDLGDLRLVYDRGRFTAAFTEDADFLRTRARVLDEWPGFRPSPAVLSDEVVAELGRIAERYR
jgi:nicotinamide phosphoribosyltransferase